MKTKHATLEKVVFKKISSALINMLFSSDKTEQQLVTSAAFFLKEHLLHKREKFSTYSFPHHRTTIMRKATDLGFMPGFRENETTMVLQENEATELIPG